MARGGNQIQTMIVVDAKTGKAVKGMKLVQSGVKNVRRATKRTTQSTKELQKAQEDLNKRAQTGSYATKEGIEGVRDLLQNSLSPELSRAATAFSGLEKVAKVMPGPVGLIAAGVGLAAVAINSVVKESREAKAQLVEAFGPERGAELERIRSDLDLASSSVIEVAKAADEAGISTEIMASHMAIAVREAEKAGREGKEGLSKLAEIIRKTTSDAQRLASAFSLVGAAAKSMDLEKGLEGTGLDTKGLNKSTLAAVTAIKERIKAIKALESANDEARKSARRTMEENRRGMRRSTATGLARAKAFQEASAKEAQAIKNLAQRKSELEEQERKLAIIRRAAENLRKRAPELRRLEQERIAEESRQQIQERIDKQDRLRDAEARARNRRAAAARKQQEAKSREFFNKVEAEIQGRFQANKELSQARLNALGAEAIEERRLLSIKMARADFEKKEHDIVRKGIEVRKRLMAARLEMENKITAINKKSEKEKGDIEAKAQSEKDSNIALAMSFIENERAKAGVSALMETAKAWGAWPDLSRVAAHGMAAAQYALVAGTGKPTLPGTGGGSDASASGAGSMVGGQTTGFSGSEEEKSQNININFGSGFAVGNSQQFGTMVNKAIKSATNTGYAQKSGV